MENPGLGGDGGASPRARAEIRAGMESRGTQRARKKCRVPQKCGAGVLVAERKQWRWEPVC